MKFAYLIMAHANANQLLRLLKQLDYPDNEIYLHLDKKSHCFDINSINNSVKRSVIHVYRKYRVYWGDYSQTQCQSFLLKKASATYHDYYHLLSGSDFPVQNNKQIHDFFERNNGKEFVHFESHEYLKKGNCKHFLFFRPLIIRTKHKTCRKTLERLEKVSIKIQDLLGIAPKLYGGANWYSITQPLAMDFLEHEKRALRAVKSVASSDEFVLQTFLKKITKKSYDLYRYEENDYHSIVRAIDWNRGGPYVWRKSDYSELTSGEYMFARKFDEKIDSIILDLLEEHNRE